MEAFVVGAWFHDNASGQNSGAAYVFAPDPAGGYTETAKLTASDVAAFDLFGNSVSVDGDTIVVGAWADDNAAGTNAGATYVYTAASDSVPDTDTDTDGVADADDDCADTQLPDRATRQLKPRHYHTVDADNDGEYEFVDPDGNVADTLADTRGCSRSQIVEAADLGRAHRWFGIPRGALNTWVNE